MKKSIIPVAAFIAGMAIVPSVFAASDVTETASWDDLAKCLTNAEDDADAGVTRTCELSEDLEVKTFNSADVKLGGDAAKVTFDLGGNTLKLTNVAKSFAKETEAEVVITNGTIDASGAKMDTLFVVNGEGSLTIADDVVIKTAKNAVSVDGKATVAVDGDIEAKDIALAVKSKDATVAVSGNLTSENNVALHQTAGAVSVNGSEIEGKAGIYISGGKIALNNATVTGNGNYDKPTQQTTGITGAAMQIQSYATEKNVESIVIANSTLTSDDSNVFHVYGNVSHGKTDLGEFKLTNVKLTPAANRMVLAKSGEDNKPGFAEYLVDGNHFSNYPCKFSKLSTGRLFH